MATVADFIPTLDFKLPSRQLLPSQSRSNEPLTTPQIRTVWLHALSLYRPFTLQTEECVLAHRNLLRHLISDVSPSTPEQTDPSLSLNNKPVVTIAELHSPSHAPFVLILFLNIGLIRAWLGENLRAKRYFDTALPMDDRNSPEHTAVLLFLHGCILFVLKQWKASRKSFERCLLCFRKYEGKEPDKGELELGLAAPWVGASIERKREAQRLREREQNMKKKFKYRVFVPRIVENEGVAPTPRGAKKNSKGKEWHEWALERTAVEANLAAAKMKLAWKESGRESEADEEFGINGFPGGVLFWPLDDSPSSAAVPALDSTSRAKTPPPAEQLTQHTPANPVLPELKAPTWNEATQSFEPYLPAAPDIVPAPSHPPPPPSTSSPSPLTSSPWLNIDSEPTTAYAQDDIEQTDLNVISPSNYATSPPGTEGTTFLQYYTDPHDSVSISTPLPRPPSRETNRQRLERAAEGRRSARGEALAALEGRRESHGEARSASDRFKGLVRRSVAGLRRASSKAERRESRSEIDRKEGVQGEGSGLGILGLELVGQSFENAVVDESDDDEGVGGGSEEMAVEKVDVEKREVSRGVAGAKEERGDSGAGLGLGDGGLLLPLAYVP